MAMINPLAMVILSVPSVYSKTIFLFMHMLLRCAMLTSSLLIFTHLPHLTSHHLCRNLSRSSLTGPIPNSLTKLSNLIFLHVSFLTLTSPPKLPSPPLLSPPPTTRYGTPGIFCNDNATCPAAPPPLTSLLPSAAPAANSTSPAVTDASSPGSANSSAPNTNCHVCQSYCLGCSSSASGPSPASAAPSVPGDKRESLRPPPPASSSALSAGAIAGIVVAALLALIALALLLWFFLRPSEPACKQYSLADIQQATNFFSEINLIGSGGFSDVYKGVDPQDPEVVWAVKRATMLSNDFKKEVKAMAPLKHPSLVPLLGYCIDYNEASRQMEQIIVSQFMPNGDLAHWTSPGAKPMSLRQRLAALVNVADGLSFLHSRRIVHRDVKPANVLLDADMRAKVADFGFMRMMEASKVNPTRVLGTPGYVDPEYHDTHLATTSTDVYSFGVLVLELLTGREPILSVDGSHSHIREWATAKLSSSDVSSIIDPRMASPAASTGDVFMVHADVMQSLASLALACTAMPAASRPSMAKVLSQLKQLHGEVVRREGESGLEQGSGFVGVGMGVRGVGGMGGVVKEKWESPEDWASAVSVTPVTGVRDTTGSFEGNGSSSAGEGTSGEASGSLAGYRN
ncbi:unnamed protein product [Closterium sp. NIES-54]